MLIGFFNLDIQTTTILITFTKTAKKAQASLLHLASAHILFNMTHTQSLNQLTKERTVRPTVIHTILFMNLLYFPKLIQGPLVPANNHKAFMLEVFFL